MTDDIKLPPLPERFNYTNSSAHWCYSRYTMVRDDLGAYVRAEDYDALRNASEALQAKVETLRAEVERIAANMLRALAQQPAAPSEDVNVAGMPEFDGLLDHIYEYGTASEGVIEKANAFARAVIARYAPKKPAAVDGAIDRARFERAPCYLCGYNGPGYYQPDTHPCAAKYHAALCGRLGEGEQR